MPMLTIISILIAAIAAIALTIWAITYSKAYYTPDESHLEISDRELLILIGEQRDGLLSIKKAMTLTGLSKAQVKKRFYAFQMKGLVNIAYTSTLKYYYSLKQPLAEGPFPILSSDPFLTIGDLMLLFKHFNYRLSIQDICMATGLPINVIAKEMKHFLKEKIIDELTQSDANGISSRKFYILRDGYRDNPEKHIEMQEEINLDLSKIYEELRKENKS